VSDQGLRSFGDGSLEDVIISQAKLLTSSPYLLSVRSARQVSYEELNDHMNSWRGAVTSWGLTDSDRVGLLVADPTDFALCFVSLLALGVWIAPLDSTVAYADASPLNARIANLTLCGVLSDRPKPIGVGAPWHRLNERDGDASAPATTGPALGTGKGGVILASSGTTGTPKVMALPSEQLLRTAGLVARHNQLDRSDRGLNPLPLWHINAEVVGLLATLLAGSSLALDDRFHRSGFWTTVERLQITWINAVPAIISRLSTLLEGESIPLGIRFVRSASAPLSPVLLQKFETNTGIAVVESYGMTEAASQICANPLDGQRKAGSVGRAIGVEVRVVSSPGIDEARPLAHDEVGLVEIRGTTVIRKYESAGYEDRFDHDGWLDTGDLGYLDDEGYLFLVGRSDDVINRGGEKIFPREIEDVILGVRGVVGAAVIGVSDEVFGQVPSSYVQLDGVSDSTPLDEVRIATKEVHDALVAAFSRARRPVTINVVAQLPTHATGKIQKKELSSGQFPVLFQEHVT
jgi:oxalate---CoA ligase